MDLDGGWRVQHFDPGDGGEAGAFDPDLDDRAWIPAAVPGDVHTSLLAAGAIPDVFYHRNPEAVQWIEDREWWFRTAIQGPPRPDDPEACDLLTFDGLDVFATAYLNGGLGQSRKHVPPGHLRFHQPVGVWAHESLPPPPRSVPVNRKSPS